MILLCYATSDRPAAEMRVGRFRGWCSDMWGPLRCPSATSVVEIMWVTMLKLWKNQAFTFRWTLCRPAHDRQSKGNWPWSTVAITGVLEQRQDDSESESPTAVFGTRAVRDWHQSSRDKTTGSIGGPEFSQRLYKRVLTGRCRQNSQCTDAFGGALNAPARGVV
jgi:hypothetical protein